MSLPAITPVAPAKPPERQFANGIITVRLDSELHRRTRIAAGSCEVSMNVLCVTAITQMVEAIEKQAAAGQTPQLVGGSTQQHADVD